MPWIMVVCHDPRHPLWLSSKIYTPTFFLLCESAMVGIPYLAPYIIFILYWHCCQSQSQPQDLEHDVWSGDCYWTIPRAGGTVKASSNVGKRTHELLSRVRAEKQAGPEPQDKEGGHRRGRRALEAKDQIPVSLQMDPFSDPPITWFLLPELNLIEIWSFHVCLAGWAFLFFS